MSSQSQQPIIRFEDIQFCAHQIEFLAHCAYNHLDDIKFIPDEFRSTYSDTVLVSYDMVLPEYKADIILNKTLDDLPVSPRLLYRAFDIYCFKPKFYRAFFNFMYSSYGNIFPGDSVDTFLAGIFILEHLLTHPDFALGAHSFSIYSQIVTQYTLFIGMYEVEGYKYLEDEYVSRTSAQCVLYHEIFDLFFSFFDDLE
jgi:hypothetical protein